jgi:hypothetical protein
MSSRYKSSIRQILPYTTLICNSKFDAVILAPCEIPTLDYGTYLGNYKPRSAVQHGTEVHLLSCRMNILKGC